MATSLGLQWPTDAQVLAAAWRKKRPHATVALIHQAAPGQSTPSTPLRPPALTRAHHFHFHCLLLRRPQQRSSRSAAVAVDGTSSRLVTHRHHSRYIVLHRDPASPPHQHLLARSAVSRFAAMTEARRSCAHRGRPPPEPSHSPFFLHLASP